MKRLIVSVLMLTALVLPGSVTAETVECHSSQYGGATCGVSTSTEVIVEHKVVETGADDNQLVAVIAAMGATALIASLLYKLTYRSYILG